MDWIINLIFFIGIWWSIGIVSMIISILYLDEVDIKVSDAIVCLICGMGGLFIAIAIFCRITKDKKIINWDKIMNFTIIKRKK